MLDGSIRVDIECPSLGSKATEGDTVLVCGVMRAATVDIDILTGGRAITPRIKADMIYIM